MEGIEKYFFPNNELTIFIFSDKKGLIKTNSERIKVVETEIEHKPFPYSTLYRYKYFLMREKEIQQMCDYVFYMDVDMKIIGEVREFEILNKTHSNNLSWDYNYMTSGYKFIIATQHPAYAHAAKNWWGSPDVVPNSCAYLTMDKWGINTKGMYCAGGFQGGSCYEYLRLCNIAAKNISIDESNNVMATWHDESHLNYILNSDNELSKILFRDVYCFVIHTPFVLPYDYCCQEGWETEGTKIIALNKDHKALRE